MARTFLSGITAAVLRRGNRSQRITMHITIMALGSMGDVLPCLALGVGLQTAGHGVRIITSENFRPLVEKEDLELHAIQFDAVALMNSRAGRQIANAGRNPWRTASSMHRTFGRLAAQYANDLSSHTLLETDAILNQLPASLYGIDIAEKAGIPYIAAAVIPLWRTKTSPMLAFPAWLSGVPGYNALSHRFAEQLVWQYFRPVINRWRREVWGLPPADFRGPFRRLYQEVPILNGFSELVVPRPPDWGTNIQTTGYWLAREPDWSPPRRLVRFLDSGPSPVYFGFGSMPLSDPGRQVRIISRALKRLNLRGVLGSGLVQPGIMSLPNHLVALDYAPFDWLFPRMTAVFHHGGSGTTAHNVCAGVPGVVVPFLFDQFYWGRRLEQLGVAAPMIPFKRFSETSLLGALDRVVNDRQIQERAQALSIRVREEKGIKNAIRVVESCFQGTNLHGDGGVPAGSASP